MSNTTSIPSFPTRFHEEAAKSICDHFSRQPNVDTVLVVNSCARGHAHPDSDLDFAILVASGTSDSQLQNLDSEWQLFAQSSPAIAAYRRSGPYAHLHLDLITGNYQPGEMEEGGMPDYFEVEIGNQLCYSAPMDKAGPFFSGLRNKWLPYYDPALKLKRLQMTRESCEYDLDRIRPSLERGLFFHAFDRLTVAFQKYLQALFISKSVYPIAYNKWIRWQIETWLGMPELYSHLPSILSVTNLEGFETAEKAQKLRALLSQL
jgi:predicted nucleotidyltransferase